jgi:hypothetical protein
MIADLDLSLRVVTLFVVLTLVAVEFSVSAFVNPARRGSNPNRN